MISRRLAVLAAFAILVSCSSPPPTAVESPSATPQATASPSPTPPPRPAVLSMRSVSPLGESIAASGDFRGSGRTQIAFLQDPTRDGSLRITVREANPDGDTFSDSVWLSAGPRSFSLFRAKLAVADISFDGKDDLVALYDEGENRSALVVFRSSGSSFAPGEKWWRSADSWQAGEFTWSRARLLAGRFGANDRDSLLIPYQDDLFDMRVYAFDSDGSKLGGGTTVFASGPGQFDAGRARFAVGHFIRAGGPQQIAALYQYPNAKARLHLLEPSASGLQLRANVFESADGELDLGRASIAASDLTGDGRDDLIVAYGDPDGSAKMQVLDAAAAFRPTNGASWATLPPGSSCAGGTALTLGDWNDDRKIDVTAFAPGDGVQFRAHVMRNGGGTFKVASTAEDVVCPRWPLNGLPLAGASPTRRPLYVKVDNNPTARPHYGIAKADQVYEWLVEGLTTRLAAVFHSQEPDVIGSVRSARMTDAPIVPSFGGIFVYSGGGPEELMQLHYDDAVAHRYIDLRPGYGWGYRVPFRPAPYNYFTTLAAVRSAIAQAPDGEQPVSIPSWDFLPTAAGDPLAGGMNGSVPATVAAVPYRGGFDVRYQYDPNTRSYARFQAGAREVDGATGQVIAAKNIVIIQTDVEYTTRWGLDPAGSPKLDMKLVGSGAGVVFRDGRRQDVTWSRPDIVDVYSVRNATGDPVRLVPGQTWIHIVPKDWAIPSQ